MRKWISKKLRVGSEKSRMLQYSRHLPSTGRKNGPNCVASGFYLPFARETNRGALEGRHGEFEYTKSAERLLYKQNFDR